MADSRPVALITGGTGGLGGAVTRAFLDRGDRAVVTYIIDEEAAEMRRTFPEIDDRLHLEKVDVTDPAAIGDLVRQIRETWGRIDSLLNLVGGWRGGPPVHETSDTDFDLMLTLNLRTAFTCCRAAVPLMIERNYGRIVNVSSRTARQPAAGQAPYAIGKAGVITLTETLALELRDYEINVNCVLPSVIDTPANRRDMAGADFSRWVRPEQLAAVLRWLTSPEADPINGAAIPVYARA